MRTFALLLLSTSLVGADDKADDAVKKEVAKLQGAWTTISLRWNGKDMPTDGKFGIQFVFKNDQATVKSSEAVEKEYAKITFKLDPSTNPPVVDLVVSSGIQKDAKIEGIYKIKDDELTICAKVFGMDRPTEFDSPEGASIVLIVLKREKK
ncbi:MAG: TIGR03067 domain-containing protein [Gemmataceae bacterium]|nr:TIGR03067 domain-containing protein [Gemmataceae bacterium]